MPDEKHTAPEVLSSMVRFDFVLAKDEPRVINLLHEYQVYLDENNFTDAKTKNNTVAAPGGGNDSDQDLDTMESAPNQPEYDPSLTSALTTHKSTAMSSVIKSLISRLEVDGHIGPTSQIGHSKRTYTNTDKDREELYDLDDDFIDDGTGELDAEMTANIMEEEGEEQLKLFYDKFEYIS